MWSCNKCLQQFLPCFFLLCRVGASAASFGKSADAPLRELLREGGGAHALSSRARHTGTTIVGVVFEGGVVLGADTRATEGHTVCDKACTKIHRLAERIFCCGAGTSADAERLTRVVRAHMVQHARLQDTCNSGEVFGERALRVETAHRMLKSHLYRARGAISAALVLGGVDATGPHLFQVHPHGSSEEVPYAALGSGSLAALSILETRHPLLRFGEAALESATPAGLTALAEGVPAAIPRESRADDEEKEPVASPEAAEASSGLLSTLATDAAAQETHGEDEPAAAAISVKQAGAEEAAAAPAATGLAPAETPAFAQGLLPPQELGLSLAEAKDLVRQAVLAGVENDMGSGGHVDLCVITAEGATFSSESAALPVPAQRAYARQPFDARPVQEVASKRGSFTQQEPEGGLLMRRKRLVNWNSLEMETVPARSSSCALDDRIEVL